MKVKAAFVLCLSALCSLSTAQISNPNNTNRWGIQSALVTKGNLSIGIVNYSDTTEFGLTVSGVWDNAPNKTSLFTPALFAGLRKTLGEHTFFAYGLDLASSFGREAGGKIDADIQIGPYISLEQQLTEHFLLIGWINPYNYEYEKKVGVSVSTNRFFSSGGIGMSYLF